MQPEGGGRVWLGGGVETKAAAVEAEDVGVDVVSEREGVEHPAAEPDPEVNDDDLVGRDSDGEGGEGGKKGKGAEEEDLFGNGDEGAPAPAVDAELDGLEDVGAPAAGGGGSATAGKEPGLRPQPEPSVLDASTLKLDESLAGRDFSGWTLKGDFSGRNFDGANLRRVVARHANFRDASMRRADASRADFRGACLVGVAAHGASLRRANCESARMAGMWGGPECDEKPEVEPLEDGTMPPMEPLARTDKVWETPWLANTDPAEEAKEDADDEAAWEAYKRWHKDDDDDDDVDDVANIVDMQHMVAE